MDRVAARGCHSDPLQIREPAPSVLIVGMAYIVAGYRSLAADFTFFGHDKTPYYNETIKMIYTKTGYIHVPEREGKLFLKCLHGLALTLLYDYVTKCCFNLSASSPAFVQGGFFRIIFPAGDI